MMSSDDIVQFIDKVKSEVLPYQSIEEDKRAYVGVHIRLAQSYYLLNDDMNAAYHLSECHGSLMRHHAVLEAFRREGCFGVKLSTSSLKWEYISSSSNYAKDMSKGLYRRLSEMPAEWTVIHLTRVASGQEEMSLSVDANPKLRKLYVSRLHCGPNHEKPLVGYLEWNQDNENNILDQLKKALKGLNTPSTHSQATKLRKRSAKAIQDIMADFDDAYFKDWKCIFLGKLQDSELEKKIRERIDCIFVKFGVEMTTRVKQFVYRLAEGVHYFSTIQIRSSLVHNFPNNKSLQSKLFQEIINIKDFSDELRTARRHPVFLVLEDHLDVIPWECMPVLKNQPVTRVISIHFLHALFHCHKNSIRHGLREIYQDKISYYILNPDGNLPSTEAKLKPFFKARLPSWVGLIGETPSTQDMIKALTSSNAYIYCGHGSGSQYINVQEIQQLTLTDSIQLLFGCQSAALKFLGGSIPMTGDMLHYSIAGSPCSLGMLYFVTSSDVDRMTVNLANYWLPGTPIDPKTLEEIGEEGERESELLRILPVIRESTDLYSNGAALVARGLPIKLLPSIS